MEVYNRKGGTYPVALLVMMLILNAYCCDSSVLVESNTTSPCNGRLAECLIEDSSELEVNPYTRRQLATFLPTQSLNRNRPVNICPTYASGRSCVDPTRTQRVNPYPRK
ncbi:receptor-like protein kinase feronia [Fagus crenata]